MIPAGAAAIAVPAVAAVGLALAGILPQLPPRSGLDRFIVAAWPVACAVEAVLAATPTRMRLVARGVVVPLLGAVLLFGSVHVAPGADRFGLAGWAAGSWLAWQAVALRADGVTLPLAILAAGLVTICEGWLRGGIAAVPLAVAVATVVPACRTAAARSAAVAAGAAGLVGLLALGRFFGGVSSLQAAALAAAACVATCPLPRALTARPGVARGVRTGLLLAALVTVVALAARDLAVRLRSRGGPQPGSAAAAAPA